MPCRAWKDHSSRECARCTNMIEYVYMVSVLDESPKPPSEPERRGLLASIGKIFGAVRGRLAPLLREDPQVAANLTPQFLKEFKEEFDRMVRERREGVTQDGESPSFLALMNVNGWETLYRIFDVLVKQYPRINNLDQPSRIKVVGALMEHCGLPGLGLA